jgi:hypothetical protein
VERDVSDRSKSIKRKINVNDWTLDGEDVVGFGDIVAQQRAVMIQCLRIMIEGVEIRIAGATQHGGALLIVRDQKNILVCHSLASSKVSLDDFNSELLNC